MKTLHFSIIIFCTMLAFLIPEISIEESITVSTDKTSYDYGDNYTISGKVNPVLPHESISIMILSTNYPHPESFSVVPGSDGKYSYTLPLPIKNVPAGNFTIMVQYAGTKNQTSFNYAGVPCNQQNIPAYVISTPIIRGPPAFNPRILDSSGNAVIGPVKAGQQIQITYTLANGLNCNMPFVYLVQIQDHNGVTVSLSWITGTLLAGQSFNPAQSWTPQHNDTYTAQIFTWQSLDNPNALVPPATVTFDVGSNENPTKSIAESPTVPNSPLKQFNLGIGATDVTCMQGLDLILKAKDNLPACVNTSTAKKLIAMGWAQNLILGPDKLVFVHNSVGTAYPFGGAMGAVGPLVNLPQKFNMSHIENNAGIEEITLFTHYFAVYLYQNTTISYNFKATAPIIFNLWLENKTKVEEYDNTFPDADHDKNMFTKINITSYSDSLTVPMTGAYVFEFTVHNPKPIATVTFDAFRK